MGRKRMHATWPAPKNMRTLKISTKKQLGCLPAVTPSRPDVSVKVRRTILRRTARANNAIARPIYFTRPFELNRDYDKTSSTTYIHQMYVMMHKIGQGCFGDVFICFSHEEEDFCAIKISNDTHAFIDFGEVRRWEKVPYHPNCVRFYKAWQQMYHLYIHMELCMTSLDKVIIINHFVREAQCWDILTDICQGLKCLHDRRLVHMDIKPANIMLTERGICKLGDFGLLHDLNEVDSETNKMRRSGVSVSEGDGKYVAIEVLREGIYSPAGDIFSLGLMMMEIASDVALPSSGEEWEGLRDGRLPICYLRRKLSANFRNLVNSMIQRDFTQRPTVDEILQNEAVQQVLSEHSAGRRINYLAGWDTQVINYQRQHPNSEALDLPAARNEGPSPPRRCYPISYQPAVETPRIALSESSANQPQNGDLSDSRSERVRRVSRRLFEP